MDISRPAEKLSRNPLGIIALFIVLAYGIAALVFGASAAVLDAWDRHVLVWFLVLFPVLLLAGFVWLVARHAGRLYSPTDFRSDKAFLEMLTPGEQAQRLRGSESPGAISENETRLPELASGKAQQAATPGTAFVAEELALREIQREFGVAISRAVRLGPDVGVDGIFAIGGRGYGVEIKLVRGPLHDNEIARTVRKLADAVKHYGWKNFAIVLALVIDSDSAVDLNRVRELVDRVAAGTGIETIVRVYDLQPLQRAYGVAN